MPTLASLASVNALRFNLRDGSADAAQNSPPSRHAPFEFDRAATERAQTRAPFLAFEVVGLSDNAPLPAGDQGLPADQPRLYNNSGVIAPRITSKSVDLRG